MENVLSLECLSNVTKLRKAYAEKRFLVLSFNKISELEMGLKSLWVFSKDHGYNFRQILIGLEYENQWVGANHSITII